MSKENKILPAIDPFVYKAEAIVRSDLRNIFSNIQTIFEQRKEAAKIYLKSGNTNIRAKEIIKQQDSLIKQCLHLYDVE